MNAIGFGVNTVVFRQKMTVFGANVTEIFLITIVFGLILTGNLLKTVGIALNTIVFGLRTNDYLLFRFVFFSFSINRAANSGGFFGERRVFAENADCRVEPCRSHIVSVFECRFCFGGLSF